MVEQWSPKPKVKGSNPFSPDLATNAETRGAKRLFPPSQIPERKRRCVGSAVTIITKK
jgi:hypothetical protein